MRQRRAPGLAGDAKAAQRLVKHEQIAAQQEAAPQIEVEAEAETRIEGTGGDDVRRPGEHGGGLAEDVRPAANRLADCGAARRPSPCTGELPPQPPPAAVVEDVARAPDDGNLSPAVGDEDGELPLE